MHPQAYLIDLTNEIFKWLEKLKEDKDYTLEYREDRDDWVFYDFFTNVWIFRLSKKYRNPKRFICGFYLDCWDLAVMSRLLKKKVGLISWQDAKKKGYSEW